ncbi:hypothetical protein [Actinoplanes siamensis]|uniref:Uncharacterized protein n=1 Tax=Actinoplanes siamensis TaxID=1223317 RepID=A0A919N5R0_9ACTN|nr:hypothetical protein [Actinoplanes siamensis]GIF04831.1 hypothetical protein Asi03nite_23690 [Actinoplanes siamensis]
MHRPTDVIGAWLFAVTMVLTIAALTRRLFGEAMNTPPDQRGQWHHDRGDRDTQALSWLSRPGSSDHR